FWQFRQIHIVLHHVTELIFAAVQVIDSLFFLPTPDYWSLRVFCPIAVHDPYSCYERFLCCPLFLILVDPDNNFLSLSSPRLRHYYKRLDCLFCSIISPLLPALHLQLLRCWLIIFWPDE